ncbi:phospholipase D A-like [Vespa velutina]|uniref:phospholipase D A-like n=1 Tax=Vespa velutina TaxID=202808 RepID=UPI001FB3B1EF|nr:phospholipase D A-like [Vespa velutina]
MGLVNAPWGGDWVTWYVVRRAPQVGDLACRVSNAPGSLEYDRSQAEELKRTAIAVESMRLSGPSSPKQGRRNNRARQMIYSSEEDEPRADWPALGEGCPAETSLSKVETGRMLNTILEPSMAAEVARLRCRNLKGELSGLMKNSYKIMMEGIKTLNERVETRADDPPSAKETIAQMKAELRAKDLRNKEVMGENGRLKRANKKMEKVLENPSAGNSRSKSPDIRESIKALTEALRNVQHEIKEIRQQQQQQQWKQQQQTQQQPQQQQQQRQQQQPQQQRQQTTGGATTGAGGPHKGPTPRAEPS